MRYNMGLFSCIRMGVTAALIVLGGFHSVKAGALTKLPILALKDLDGKEWSQRDFSGNPVLIDFWATWCVSCKATVPKLSALQKKYRDQGLIVVGISVDKGATDKVRKWGKKQGMDYLVLLDPEDSMSKVFGFEGIPSLYLFNKKGDLVQAMPSYDADQESVLNTAVAGALK